MKRLIDRPDLLVLRDFPWFWAAFCLLMFVAMAANLYQVAGTQQLDWFQIAVIVAALIGAAVGTVVFARHTLIEIQPATSQLRWQSTTLRGRSTRVIPFADIDSVVLETSRKENLQLARVVVHTRQGSLPLTNSYSAKVDEAESLVHRMRELMAAGGTTPDESVLQDSVEALVAQNRLIDAARMLCTESGVSVENARARVHELKRDLDHADGRGSSQG